MAAPAKNQKPAQNIHPCRGGTSSPEYSSPATAGQRASAGSVPPYIITTWYSTTYISLQYPWHCCMNSSGALHSFGNEPHWRGFTGCIWQRFFSVRNMHAPSSFSRKTSPRRSRASFVYLWMSSPSEIPRYSAILPPSSGRYLTCPSQRQQAPQHRQWKTFISFRRPEGASRQRRLPPPTQSYCRCRRTAPPRRPNPSPSSPMDSAAATAYSRHSQSRC